MYIIFEVNGSDKTIAREFRLVDEAAVAHFVNETDIPLKKEWLKDDRFAEHLFEELAFHSDDELGYVAQVVTLH